MFAAVELKTAQAAHLRHEMGIKRIKTGHDIEMERRAADRDDRSTANG